MPENTGESVTSQAAAGRETLIAVTRRCVVALPGPPASSGPSWRACLTIARSGETLGARWPEVDLAEKVWIVPAERMKGKREHRVPLSGRAVGIRESAAYFVLRELGQVAKPERCLTDFMLHEPPPLPSDHQ